MDKKRRDTFKMKNHIDELTLLLLYLTSFKEDFGFFVIGIKLLGQNYIVPVLDGLFYISPVHSGQNN